MKAAKNLPTDSIEELARFWDTHDLTDFEDQLEIVTEPVFQREAVVEIHLPEQEAAVMQKFAATKGLRSQDLIREWVLEKLRAA